MRRHEISCPSSGTRKRMTPELRIRSAGKITYAVAQGSSQSGNFVRTFIHLGFNQDESGQIVWDGAMPHIAGRQLALNFRFALPDGAVDPYEIGSEGVLWWEDWADKTRAGANPLDCSTAAAPRKPVRRLWKPSARPSFGICGCPPDSSAQMPPKTFLCPIMCADIIFPEQPTVAGPAALAPCRSAADGPSGSLRASGQSQSPIGHDARAARSNGGMDRKGRCAATQPISARHGRHIGTSYKSSGWFSGLSRSSVQGQF